MLANSICVSKRAYVFRCLMFSLSGPCELLFILCFNASWTRVVVSVMLYPCVQSVFLELVKVHRFCYSLYSCHMLIGVMMNMWSDDSAC